MILPLAKIGLNEANPEVNSPLRVRIVEELRANPKVTQIGLATKLGVSRAIVRRYECPCEGGQDKEARRNPR